MSVAEKIINLLKEQGRSQIWLAKKVGVTPVTVCRYVAGERVPRAVELVKMAEALNTSTDYLLGITSNGEKEKSMLDRISNLHQEIQYRDNRILELEGQLLVKDSIIRKQAVMLVEKCW